MAGFSRSAPFPHIQMHFRLPPPDPNESLGMAPADGFALAAPVVVYVCGRPSAEIERVSDAILARRPGALFVVARD
jgi:hypothetical protein